MHYALSTETAYIGWVERFMKHVGSEELEKFGAPELKDFLTDLAVKGEVAASTQNQALSGVMFFYQRILGRELEFIDAVKAKRPQHLPLVMSRRCLVESQVLGAWCLVLGAWCLVLGWAERRKKKEESGKREFC